MRSFLCMRRAQQCRIRQAVCRQAIVTRASRSKARLRAVTIRRRLMAKPCTPHLITRKGYATSVRQQSCQRLCNAQRVQLFKLQTANVGGRGVLPSRSLGGPRGIFSHVREYPPFPVQRHRRCFPAAQVPQNALHLCEKANFLKTETFSIFLRLKR